MCDSNERIKIWMREFNDISILFSRVSALDEFSV